ncbi:MAG: L,D-transpeptidase family protein [Xanthobacteraceae bacterium]|nr:L,D-transpeptidase family protein [Xanthobacteraceae bacterium]
MRRFLLATTAAAVVLTLSGRAQAEPDYTLFSPRKFVHDQTQNNQSPAASGKTTVAQADQGAKPAAADQTAKAAPVELGPIEQQLKELAESRLQQYVPREQDRAGVLAFYRDRNFAPIWTAERKAQPRAEQASSFLAKVGADGLDPADYPAPKFDNADPAKLAADELTMTNSVLTFARHASIGRVAFTRVSGAVYFDQKAPDAAEVLNKLAESADVRATLDAFNPQHPAYKALKAQLAAARRGKFSEIDNNRGPVKAAAEPTKETKSKRKSKGATEDQIEAKPAAANIDTIIANLERWRWMPHDLGPTYVMVNIPDFTLKVVQDGKPVWHTKIVAGKVGNQATPLLTETMKFITVNPTWNVPPSIIRNEYLPALARDPNALARIGLQVGRNADGSIRIYQPPGERNALGRIRFNFPNRFLVYQHDTPDKKLFDHTVRAYSHGCMRVQNPDKYAEVLLGVSQPEERYTADRIQAMYGKGERTINFKNPIPVYLTYQTAFVDDAGQLQARADLYGHDKEITRILHGERRVADIPVRRNYSNSGGGRPSTTYRTVRRDDYYQDNWGYSGGGWGGGWGGRGGGFRQSSQNFFQPRFGTW